MEFSNPSITRRDNFTFCKTRSVNLASGHQQCSLPAGWQVVCEPQSQALCQQWLDAHWTTTLTPAHYAVAQEAQ
ncbi:enterochelin esterase (ferric enterobactin esterase) [Citrobacter koseri]|uniref:Enterochelin esterase (Ferric enterobactin esterase) n=1 Tax=Citrobacter koseri TaxID=545 RepID=A0A2X2UYF2_CITKO|nr:enterochelin esterase (ferric enterobactin esterase) [Citrobacter koseri]